jgi:hypothetical protein
MTGLFGHARTALGSFVSLAVAPVVAVAGAPYVALVLALLVCVASFVLRLRFMSLVEKLGAEVAHDGGELDVDVPSSHFHLRRPSPAAAGDEPHD